MGVTHLDVGSNPTISTKKTPIYGVFLIFSKPLQNLGIYGIF